MPSEKFEERPLVQDCRRILGIHGNAQKRPDVLRLQAGLLPEMSDQ